MLRQLIRDCCRKVITDPRLHSALTFVRRGLNLAQRKLARTADLARPHYSRIRESRAVQRLAQTVRRAARWSKSTAIALRSTDITNAGAGKTPAWLGSESGSVPPAPPIGRWIGIGLIVGGVFFVGFGGWAALAPLASASMANGVITVDSNRKTIQHYEGGIIREILVRDGDQVRGGEVLVRLDDVEARADHEGLQGQLDALMAREARLVAQRDGLEEVAFPDSLRQRKSNLETAMILEGQARIFADQEASLNAEIAVWRQRSQQYRAQIGALEAQNETLAHQLGLLEEELEVAEQMFERGYERKPRVLALQREISNIQGGTIANDGRIASLNEQISEAELQITSLRENRRKSVSEELRDVQTARAELAQRMEKSAAQVGRKDIVAPQDGVVVNLRHFTPGGVIAPGADVLDLVPKEDKLVAEVRVNPMDIDIVRQGLKANVRLIAFQQRNTPTLTGRLVQLSADAVTDERTGEYYFQARVEVDPDEMSRVPQLELYPGMPVEVAIVTGERTFLTYLVQPFRDSFARAFRE